MHPRRGCFSCHESSRESCGSDYDKRPGDWAEAAANCRPVTGISIPTPSALAGFRGQFRKLFTRCRTIFPHRKFQAGNCLYCTKAYANSTIFQLPWKQIPAARVRSWAFHCPLKFFQQLQSCIAGRAAKFDRGIETAADGRPVRISEQPAAIVCAQLHAPETRRLAFRHAWNRRTDGRSDAAGATAGTALHVRYR